MDQERFSNRLSKSFCSVLIDGNRVDLTPLKIDYTGEMNSGILKLEIKQLYKNDVDNSQPSSKAFVVLPRNDTQCITGVECSLNGETVKLNIEDETKAEEIEREASQSGLTSIRSVNSGDQSLIINIGQLSFGSECEITIRMEILSTNLDSKTYQTVIPFSEQPLNSDENDNFHFSIVMNEIDNIEDVTISSSFERSDFEYTFDGSILTIDKKPLCPIVLLTKLTNNIVNSIQNDQHDEYSIVSVIPHFLNKTVNSDFIFIVDCSGSMSGSRIRNASECLTVFLHSLPVGCKFNIVKFGSLFQSVFGSEGLVEYNEANLRIAESHIENLRANMGGTNLLGPLTDLYRRSETNIKNGNVVQIFLLTDGEIHDTEEVFKLVRKNRSKNRIFSIGIGNDADRNLVSGLAVLSAGKFDFVSESSQITDKVVNLLSLALAPALTNITVHAVCEGENDDSIEVVPNPMTPFYDGNLMHIYIKRSKSNPKPIDNVLITGCIGDEETEIAVDEVFNISDLSAKNLFAFNAIKDYERLFEELKERQIEGSRYRRLPNDEIEKNKQELDKLKDKIVTLSVESGILSQFTSFVGVENKTNRRRRDDEALYGCRTSRNFDNFVIGSALPRGNKELIEGPEEIVCSESGRKTKSRGKAKACFSNKIECKHHKASKQQMNTFTSAKQSTDIPKPAQLCENLCAARCDSFDADAVGDAFDDFDDDADVDYFAGNIKRESPMHYQMQPQSIGSRPPAPESKSFGFGGINNAPHAFRPPPKQEKIEFSLQKLISLQDFDGKWKKELYEQLLDFWNDENKGQNNLAQFLDTLKIEGEEAGSIKATFVALCLLNTSFSNEKSRWRFIERKAISWLNSKMSMNWEDEINKLTSKI